MNPWGRQKHYILKSRKRSNPPLTVNTGPSAVSLTIHWRSECSLYWTIAQLVAHHASNGCNLRTGDLLATGTVSGSEAGSEGCLLEKRNNAEPIRLPDGEARTYLEDGDRITLCAYAQRPEMPRIGFGICSGTIAGAFYE